MKFLFDLFPVILFFAAFKLAENHREVAASLLDRLFDALGLAGGVAPEQAPLLISTIVAILATIGQIAWVHFRHGKVDKMLWVSLGLVVVFGGATLLLRDPTYIKWKPTVLYWVFAGVLAGSALFLRKNLIRAMLEQQVVLPEPVWLRLNLSWVAFFTVMGGLNLYVAFNYSESDWVNFKLFGGMGLMLVFIVAQGLLLAKYVEQTEKETP